MGRIVTRYSERATNGIARSERQPQQMRNPSAYWPLLIILAGLGGVIFSYDGFTGVALLGLAILFVALQFDIDHGTASNSYLASQIAERNPLPQVRAAAAVRCEEIETESRPLYLAKLFGLGLIVIGIGSRLI